MFLIGDLIFRTLMIGVIVWISFLSSATAMGEVGRVEAEGEVAKSVATVVKKVDLKALVSRSEARWTTIIDHAFNETYQFETPAYKDVFTVEMFVSRFNRHMNWTFMSRKDPVYDPETKVATVVVEVETQPMNSKGLDTGAPAFSVEIREKWLNYKSQWWYSSSE